MTCVRSIYQCGVSYIAHGFHYGGATFGEDAYGTGIPSPCHHVDGTNGSPDVLKG